MNSSITFKYRISKVETLGFNINTDVYQSGTPVKMKISFKNRYIEESHLVCVECIFQISNVDFENSFLKVALMVTYEIHQDDVKQIVTGEKDKVIINPSVIKKLQQISYDTLRGVLHVKTEGTSFNSFYLPSWDIPLPNG